MIFACCALSSSLFYKLLSSIFLILKGSSSLLFELYESLDDSLF